MTLFATLDSIHPRPARRRLRPPLRGGRGDRRAGVGGAPRRPRAEPLGGLRPDPQPPRLAAARPFGHGPDADGHDDPRVLLTPDPARLRAFRRRLRLDLGRRPRPGARVRRDDPSRRRHDRAAVLGDRRRRARLLRSHPPRHGPARAIEIARRAERPLVRLAAPCRTSATSPRRSSPTSTGTVSGPSARSATRSAPRSSGRPAASSTPSPSPSRSACRSSSRCLRDAGRRLLARVDAGDRRGRRHRRPRARRRLGRARGPARDALGPRHLPSSGRAPLLRRPHGRRLPRGLRRRPGDR